MTLLDTLAIGSYLYTTAVFLYFRRKIDTILANHLKTIEKRLDQLEDDEDG